MARDSQLVLRVAFPETFPGQVTFQSPDRGSWTRELPAPAAVWSSEALLNACVRVDGKLDLGPIESFGLRMADWLFDDRARNLLMQVAALGERASRIELLASTASARYAWEALHLPNAVPLAVGRGITLVRSTPGLSVPLSDSPRRTSVHLIGVDLPGTRRWPRLKTTLEIRRIHEHLNRIDGRRRLRVQFDPLGSWQDLKEAYEEDGPPSIFHFAGHGLEDGAGLVFRGARGRPEEVGANQLAKVLMSTGHRRTCLAFLNACYSSSSDGRRVQPFGGLGHRLTLIGVPAVIGAQTSIEDSEATMLAEVFYRELVNGATVDVAIQAARASLYLQGQNYLAWAFTSLTLACDPASLLLLSEKASAYRPSNRSFRLFHRLQRDELANFLERLRPMVVVIHGEARTGHRFVSDRVKADLKQADRNLWEPVPTVEWFVPGNPELSRQQLAGALAAALGLGTSGLLAGLERRIGTEIASRCAMDKTVVFELVEPIALRTQAEASAVIALVRELWIDLMAIALEIRSSRGDDELPVFLLLSLAYPRLLLEDAPRAERANQRRSLVREVVEELGRQPRPRDSPVRVKVLPELLPFREEDVASILDEVLDISVEEARAMAADIVDEDNEMTLWRMERLFDD
jgi:CHAT domain